MTKREIIKAFEMNIDLFDETDDGWRECAQYTADRLNIALGKVERAVYE